MVCFILSKATFSKFLTMSTEFEKKTSQNKANTTLITQITLKTYQNIFRRS